MDPLQYWDMTLWEIQKTIEGKNKRYKSELETNMRVSAMIAYRQADLIASLVSIVLGGKNKSPTLHEVFPGVFAEEGTSKPRQQQDWRIMKARLEAYASARKKWGERKNGDNNRGTTSPNNSKDERTAEGDRQGQGSNESGTDGYRGRNKGDNTTV